MKVKEIYDKITQGSIIEVYNLPDNEYVCKTNEFDKKALPEEMWNAEITSLEPISDKIIRVYIPIKTK